MSPDLNALLDAATPGPWNVQNTTACYDVIQGGDRTTDSRYIAMMGVDYDPNDGESFPPHHDADAALIVAAVNALPRLLEIERAASEWMDADWAELQGLSSPPGAADLNLLGLRVTSAKRAMTASLSPQEPTP